MCRVEKTVEFEVTEDRLGVYLPVEHIDNPRYISCTTLPPSSSYLLGGMLKKKGTPEPFTLRSRIAPHNLLSLTLASAPSPG